MQPSSLCQRCGRAATEDALRYRRGDGHVAYPSLLQCDVCERFACSACLEVYDILSGYDFLCVDCARQFPPQTVPEDADRARKKSVARAPRRVRPGDNAE